LSETESLRLSHNEGTITNTRHARPHDTTQALPRRVEGKSVLTSMCNLAPRTCCAAAASSKILSGASIDSGCAYCGGAAQTAAVAKWLRRQGRPGGERAGHVKFLRLLSVRNKSSTFRSMCKATLLWERVCSRRRSTEVCSARGVLCADVGPAGVVPVKVLLKGVPGVKSNSIGVKVKRVRVPVRHLVEHRVGADRPNATGGCTAGQWRMYGAFIATGKSNSAVRESFALALVEVTIRDRGSIIGEHGDGLDGRGYAVALPVGPAHGVSWWRGRWRC